MNANEIIQYISNSEKKTPVKVYLKETKPIPFKNCKIFGCTDRIVFGEWSDIRPVLEAYAHDIEDIVVESDRRNSAIPMLDIKDINARIEPGAIIREHVEIGRHAVIMMVPMSAEVWSPLPSITSTSPGLASDIAAWIIRLSPGRTSTVSAGPASFIVGRNAVMRPCMAPRRPATSAKMAG